jgi:hypothetical protein
MTDNKTSFCWLHIGTLSSVESTHLPEYTREQAEAYGRSVLSDWVMSAPRPKNDAADTLEVQLQGAEFYRAKLKGENK